MTYKIIIPFILVLLFMPLVKEKMPAADAKNMSAKDRLNDVRVNNYSDMSNSALFSSELLRLSKPRQ